MSEESKDKPTPNGEKVTVSVQRPSRSSAARKRKFLTFNSNHPSNHQSPTAQTVKIQGSQSSHSGGNTSSNTTSGKATPTTTNNSTTPTTQPTISNRSEASRRMKEVADSQNEIRKLLWSNSRSEYKFTQFNILLPILQRNYASDYLKRDEQVLVLRNLDKYANRSHNNRTNNSQASNNGEELSAEKEENDEDDVESVSNAKTPNSQDKITYESIVIHFGSQNLRIGRGKDAYPIQIPNVIAHKINSKSDSQNNLEEAQNTLLEEIASDEFEKDSVELEKQLKQQIKKAKLRIVPNAHEIVVNYNRRKPQENCKNQMNNFLPPEWTDLASDPEYLVGEQALNLSPEEAQKYKLFWPIREGVFNEDDYTSKEAILCDQLRILKFVLCNSLNLASRDRSDHSVVLIIPDLFESNQVEAQIDLLFNDLNFGRVSVVQESLCATFGAGMSSAVVIDFGAQKTSIACVDEGLVIPDSRITLRYGGKDLTKLFTQLLLRSELSYRDIDLTNGQDFQIMEALKKKNLTASETSCTVSVDNFMIYKPDGVFKCEFKMYDENILPCLAVFDPSTLGQYGKMKHRRRFFKERIDQYDGRYIEPESKAQNILLKASLQDDEKSDDESEMNVDDESIANENETDLLASERDETISRSSPVPSARDSEKDGESLETPTSNNKSNNNNSATSQNNNAAPVSLTTNSKPEEKLRKSKTMLHPLIWPLDDAINQSIYSAVDGDLSVEAAKTYYQSILLVGASANIPGFPALLEDKIREKRPNFSHIEVVPPPRGMDPQLISWKGACVFSKIQITADYWIEKSEWDVYKTRTLHYKSLGLFF